jgi:hypothetical protein
MKVLGQRTTGKTPRATSSMSFFPVFLSVVCVLRNHADLLERIVQDLGASVQRIVTDYELIVVDNASTDDSLELVRKLTGPGGEPNLQVYALTKEVDGDTASWVGMENALGDFVVVVDPLLDDIHLLPEMLNAAMSGADVVFAANTERPARGFTYNLGSRVFCALYRTFSGVDLATDAPRYRVLSKRVINFILQHPQPAVSYRHLPATGGFSKVNLTYSALPKVRKPANMVNSIDRGMRLLVSTSRAPLRIVTSVALFGAVMSLVYSVYVIAIALLKDQVAPGWVSLSLQQSGMFLLFSLELLVLGEYLLNMASCSSEGPRYHVAQEFTSARVSRREKLNVEERQSHVPTQMPRRMARTA